MAKVRVYELAKDLNMTNRALLNKMKELKIVVKSHMSSLEDIDIKAIRKGLLGKAKKKVDVIAKQSVIRRRRPRAEEIDEAEVEAEPEESIAPVKESVEDKSSEPVKEKPDEDSKSIVTDKTPKVSEESEIEKVHDKQKVKPKKDKTKPKTKKGQPAKIVKPVAKEEPVPEPEKIKTPEVKEKEPEVEPKIEKPVEIQQEDPVKKPEKSVKPGEIDKAAVEKKVQAAAVEDKENKDKKKKKKKKSAPAKIVKIADPKVLASLKKSSSAGDNKNRNGLRKNLPDVAKKRPFKKRETVVSPGSETPKKYHKAPVAPVLSPEEIADRTK
jgi:translation initiation factor IF-2